MGTNRLIYLASALCLLISWPVAASEALYETRLEVADQSAKSRLEAMPLAMEQVLVKVSGYSEVADNPFIKAGLTRVGRYVQQFRYSQEARPADVAEDKPGESPQRLMLWLRFDKKGIDQLLKEAGVPVWGSNRPLTLIWLVVEQGRERILVGANDKGRAREYLQQQAEQRALPVRLPLLDLADTRKIRPVDVWGDFREVILAASARYEAQAVLTGKLKPVASGYSIEWKLYREAKQFVWRAEGDDVEALLAAGIDKATDNLAMLFTESYETGGFEAVFVVEGVSDFGALRRVINYLKSVPGIAKIHMEQVEATTLRLKVDTGGGLTYVLKGIAAGNTLRRVEQLDEVTFQPVTVGPQGAVSEAAEGHPDEVTGKQSQEKSTELVFRLLP
jgi:hypothetical protein